MKSQFLFFLFIIINLLACQSDDKKQEKNQAIQEVTLQYAKRFSIKKYQTHTSVQLWEQGKPLAAYKLVTKQQYAKLTDKKNAIVIPIQKFATLSTTDLAAIDDLKLHQYLVGVPEKEYINSPTIQKMLTEQKTQIVGGAVSTNIELLVALKPQIIFTTTPWDASDKSLEKFKELGLQTVLNSSYLEETPLGRAEWIKFIAVFFDKLPEAEQIFRQIATDYQMLAQLVTQNQVTKPTVLLNIPYAGTWYVPGGKSYMANLIKDAGANYLWQTDNQAKSLALGLEAILQKAASVDYWIHFDNTKNSIALQNLDKRYNLIKAFRQQNLWNNDLANNQLKGNDFYEAGALHPEWILADLIKIFHPEIKLNNNYQKFRFYRKL